MRILLALLAATGLLGVMSSAAHASGWPAAASLAGALQQDMQSAGGQSSALVLDLTTGRTLYALKAKTGRMPASVEKLYTTTTALTRLGPDATLTTELLGTGQRDGAGTWRGTLYLRGGGDPTFGTAAFDESNYGTGASVQRLVANLLQATQIKRLTGAIAGDESVFDSLRGTPPYGYAFDSDEEGELSGLAFDRDVNSAWTAPVADPPVYAARNLAAALRAAHVKLSHVREVSASTPAGATLLASVHSPRMATLVDLTNRPSDNFFAEMLLKDLGARVGGAGSTAAGAAVVRAQLAQWGIHPALEDGSGLSRNDRSSPDEVVKLLKRFATDATFVASLPLAGVTGTLRERMGGTAAQGRCEAKTGTLRDASDLAGYCQARDHHVLAFALLMNAVNPDNVYVFQDRAAEAMAAYDG